MTSSLFRTSTWALQVLLISSLVNCAIFPAEHYTQVKSHHSHIIDNALFPFEEDGPPAPDFQELFASSKLSNIDPHVQAELLGSLVMPQYLRDISEALLLQRSFQPSQFENGSDFDRDILFKGIENDSCKGHILEFLIRFSNWPELWSPDKEKDTWVLHMMDSWGKVPEGILSGHVNVMGDFDECIDIKVRDLEILNDYVPDKTEKEFEGRYCTIYIADYWTAMNGSKVPVPIPEPDETGTSFDRKMMMLRQDWGTQDNETDAVSLGELLEMILGRIGVPMIPSMGMCLPNSCSRGDIQQFLVNSLDILYRLDPDSEGGNGSYPLELPWPLAFACYQKKKPDFDAADISVMALLACFFALCLGTGVVDYWLNHEAEGPKKQRGTIYQYFMAFSFYTNMKTWMSTTRPPGDFECLHALRFFSTSWIILAHTYYAVTFLPQWNMVDVKRAHEDWTILTVLNSSLSVDTFFVIGGMLMTFNLIKTLQRTNGKLNLLEIYAKRYFRLTPPYAMLVGIMATLIPYMGNGPYWAVMDNWAGFCETNWWTNLLYVNNLVNTSFLCQGETWYLANDMQFCILAPFIVYPLWKREVVGLILLSVYSVLSLLTPMFVVLYLDISPTVIPTREFQNWDSFTNLYIRPYTRISSYLVGVWLGWILFKTKGKRIKLPMYLVTAFWLISTGVCLAVVYAIHPWFDPQKPIPTVEAMAYAGLGRPAFGVAVAWIIFACCKGYGGVVQKFLSWKVFLPLARLCYCVYLVSLHLQMILHVRFKQPIKYDPYVQVNFFFSHMVMSYLVGLVLWLLFESPFLILQKLIFDGPSKPKPQLKTSKRLSKPPDPDPTPLPEKREEAALNVVAVVNEASVA